MYLPVVQRISPFLVLWKWKILLGVDFLTGGGHLRRSTFDHLIIQAFFKVKKHSVNIGHQLKSKLVWAVCTKSLILKKYGAGTMATVKNGVFIGFLLENCYLVGRELTFGGGRSCSRCGMSEQFFCLLRNYPCPQLGRTYLINIYNIYIILYNNLYIYTYIYI